MCREFGFNAAVVIEVAGVVVSNCLERGLEETLGPSTSSLITRALSRASCSLGLAAILETEWKCQCSHQSTRQPGLLVIALSDNSTALSVFA